MNEPPIKRIVVIANPATRKSLHHVEHALARISDPGIEITLVATERAGHAFDLAVQMRDQADLFLAAGGDGTVADVASGLRGTNIPLGIIPCGSTNIIARELGIPTRIEAAIDLVLGRYSLSRLDVGTCNDKAFLHMAGAGFDSEFFDLTDPSLKRKIGWLAYLPAAMRALRRPMATYTVTTPDAQLIAKSPLVLVANGGSIINPRLKLDRDISKEDGVLDLLIVTATRPVELAQVFARLMTMRLGKSRFVQHFQATDIRIEADPPMPVELDGDVIFRTPVQIGIDPGAIQIITPR